MLNNFSKDIGTLSITALTTNKESISKLKFTSDSITHYFIYFFVLDDDFKVFSSSSGYETTMQLTIRAIQPQDLGSFRCVAKNALGETDGKIKLYSKYDNTFGKV